MPEIVLPTLPWQADFLEAPDPEKVVIGGVGSGKSIICADWLIERAMIAPHANHYIIGDSHPTMKEGTIPTFESRLEEHGFDYRRNGQDLSITIESGPAKGCRIIAWTAQRYRKLKGQLIDSAWCDEAQVWFDGGARGADAYDFIVNRMRPSESAQKHHPTLTPQLVLSANPPHATSHWLYRYFVEENKARLFHVTTFDNWLMPGIDEYVERLRRQYSPELFKIEVLGEWGDIGVGLVYSQFLRARNVAETIGGAPVEFDRSMPLEWTHDFGVTPRVSLLCQTWSVDLPGFQPEVLVVFDEISLPAGSTADQITEFVRRFPADEVGALQIYGDPAGQTRNSTTGVSDWAMLAGDERIKAYRPTVRRRRAAPPIVDRTNAVNSKLCNAAGDVGVIFHPRCKRAIEDHQTTRWKDGARILDHGSPAQGIFRTHWSDAGGYLIEYKWPLRLGSGAVFTSTAAGRGRSGRVQPA